MNAVKPLGALHDGNEPEVVFSHEWMVRNPSQLDPQVSKSRSGLLVPDARIVSGSRILLLVLYSVVSELKPPAILPVRMARKWLIWQLWLHGTLFYLA